METNLVYVITSYGKVKGCYQNAKDAFDAQMILVYKGQIAEMIPCPIIQSNFNSYINGDYTNGE